MKKLHVSLAVFLAWSLACLPLSAAAPGAMMSTLTGPVTLNGHHAIRGEAVGWGDQVQTGVHGFARLALPGASVMAASNTQFRMESLKQAKQLRLMRGAVEVNGRLPVAFGGWTVVPANAQTRYSISEITGRIQITTLAGRVELRSAHHRYTINAGEAATLARSPQNLPSGTGSNADWTYVGIGTAALIGGGLLTYFIYRNNHNGNVVSVAK